jgi:GntR family transcriptional regulator, transcriptional repressor for pyruvate dehydrogenase complex
LKKSAAQSEKIGADDTTNSIHGRNQSLFKKYQQNRIFEDLAAQIETAILDGRIQVGDKLPPQRDLVEMFQASRAPLREALRVLEHKGLIVVKRGARGGAVVKLPDTDPAVESLALLVRHRRITLAELSEFREGVEGNVAALASQRTTGDDIRQLKNFLGQAKTCMDKGVASWESFNHVDNKVHVAIARIAGNRVYEFVLRMVHENIRRFYEDHPLKDLRFLQENYQDLCDITSALEKKQSTVARSLMQSHVRRFNRHMNETTNPNRTTPND